VIAMYPYTVSSVCVNADGCVRVLRTPRAVWTLAVSPCSPPTSCRWPSEKCHGKKCTPWITTAAMEGLGVITLLKHLWQELRKTNKCVVYGTVNNLFSLCSKFKNSTTEQIHLVTLTQNTYFLDFCSLIISFFISLRLSYSLNKQIS
jgi:hypothetical protein